MALSSTSGDAGPNFNESRGCGDGQEGVRSPYVGTSGVLSGYFRVYGPKADFFGRDRDQLLASMLNRSGNAQWLLPPEDRTPQLHERLLPALVQVRQNLIDGAASNGAYPVRDLSDRVFRTVAGATYLSNHAFGNALDINPQQNLYSAANKLTTDLPEWFVDAWRAAGFCWGGDWVALKDAMHFSWMGPLATSGYGSRLAPYPPLTAAAPFAAAVVDVATAYGATVDPLAMADRSHDGADDLYRVRSAPGGLVVEAAGARSQFSVIGYRVATAMAADPADTTFADFDGDARPDLVVFDRSVDTFTAWSDASAFEEIIATGPIPDGDAELAFGFNDTDWALDLFAVTPGPTTMVTVYNSSADYAPSPPSVLGFDSTGWAFALGDYDVDGNDDLYAVNRATNALHVAVAESTTFQLQSVDPAPTALTLGSGQLLIGDYDGDGRDDLYVARDGRLQVHLGGMPKPGDTSDPISRWFLPEDPASWDAGPECLGGHPCDQIAFVDGKGEWFVRDETASESDEVAFFYGNPGDVPMAGDWNGDGTQTPGLYRQSDGYVYLRNSSDAGTADVRFFFGNPGDVPIAGDFDGDGDDTVSLFRPSEQRFYIVNELGSASKGLGAAEINFVFGNPGDKPFVGDLDGNGIDDVGLHRESTGLVYYRLSLTQGVADGSFIFGDPGDAIVAGDWDGDGTDTLAVFRPSKGDWFLKLSLTDGAADHVIHHHDDNSAVRPVVGRFGTESQ